MKKALLLVIPALLIFSCGGEKKESNHLAGKNKFVADTILVDDQNIPYPSDSVPQIMEKAGMCMCDTAKARENGFAPCDATLFRYFRNSRKPLKEGFLVEVRPLILSKSYRVIQVVQNEEGAYKIANDYSGQLLEMRTTRTGNYDIVIRYFDKEVGTVAILHKWKEYHYEPVEVLELNDHFVKPDKKDSLNSVYIENFTWGF